LFFGQAAASASEQSKPSLKDILSSNKTRFWFNSGFGPSTVKFANGGTVNFQYSQLLVSVIYDYNWEYNMLGPEPEKRAYEIGLAAGTSFGNRFGTVAFAVGPSFTAGVNRGDFLYKQEGWLGAEVYEREDFRTVGFTVHSHVIFTPLPFLGIGVHGYGNLNAKRSYAGAMGACILENSGRYRR